MVDFIRIPKKRPFKERMRMIGQLLNDNGEVSVRDLVVKWGITPHYAKTMLRWAPEFFPYAKWDGDDRILYIPERRPEAAGP